MNLEPLSDKIVIRKIDLEVRSKGGMILGTEVEKDRETSFGKVMFAGPGKRLDTTGTIPNLIKEGDIIAFLERVPRRCSYKGEFLYILRESDVDFIVRDTDVVEKPYELEGYEYDKGVTRM